MPSIPMGRTRPQETPWLIVESGSWEYRVLKAYSADPDKPYARWLCAVRSPFTGPFPDLGDTYIRDVQGRVTFQDPSVPGTALPSHLRRA